MKETESVISDIRLSRKNLVELIIIVVLLSFGINIIASQFLTWLKDQVVILTIIGTFLCILPVLYALISLFGKRKKQISVQGFVIYDPTKKELVNVPRYFFAQSMCTYIRAAFFENAAFKVRWNKQPLNPFKITPAGKESDAG